MKHPQTQHHSASARSATAALLAALLTAGPVLAEAPSTNVATGGSTAPASAPAAIDAELVRQLLSRIEQLEKRDAARTNATSDEVTRKLQQRIAELEQQRGMQVVEAIAVRRPLILKMEILPQEVMADEPRVVAVVQAVQALDIQELVLLIQLRKHQTVVQALSRV
jgi:hypothetical protein